MRKKIKLILKSLRQYKTPAIITPIFMIFEAALPTLCDPIDGSPPGSPIPGILQARTLE